MAALLLALSITSCGNEGNGLAPHQVPSPELGVSDSLFFDYFVDTLTFTVENSGTAAMSWVASTSADYLSVEPGSGSLAPEASSTVKVTLDRSGLTTGSYTSVIHVSSDAGQSDTIAVGVEHFDEPKWLLEQPIVDAEFNRATNRIVAVTSDPPALLRLDPESRTIESVLLFYPPPTCVSVSADGAYAAVGHAGDTFNGFITYVDLNAMSVVDTYPTTTDAFDIVLAPGWVYLFPREDQGVYVRCIELSTGLETLHSGRQIYEKTIGRLHPSEDMMYVLDTQLSPNDFHKLDVQSGTAAYLYDSPYHGTYVLGDDFWISQDGARLISASGRVFNTATSQAGDMTYAGQLDGLLYAPWIEHSTSAGRIFGIAGNTWPFVGASEIRVYGDEFFGFQGTIPLPPFLVPDGLGGGRVVDSEGRYVFCNLAGTRLYTLVRAAGGSGTAPWAVWATDAPLP